MYPDHTVLITTTLEETAANYERLGFALSPPSYHHLAERPSGPLVPACTANRCAYFGTSFLELLGIVKEQAPDPWGVRRLAAAYQGGLLLTLSSPDARADADRLKAEGLSDGQVRALKRTVVTPAGLREIRADSVLLDPRLTPGTALQVTHHFTPEHVHQKHYLDHPNGAKALLAVHLVVPDADLTEHTAIYKRIQADHIDLIPESALDQHFPGFRPQAIPLLAAQTIGVQDLTAARRLIESNGIPTHTTPTGFYVDDTIAIGFRAL